MFVVKNHLNDWHERADAHWAAIRNLIDSKYDLTHVLLESMARNDAVVRMCVESCQRFLANPKSVSILVDVEWATHTLFNWLSQETVDADTQSKIARLIRIQEKLEAEISALDSCIDDHNAVLAQRARGRGYNEINSAWQERVRRGLELPPVLVAD